MTSSRDAFLDWLDGWYAALPQDSLHRLVEEAGGADHISILVVDLIVGFCSEGPLASPRVQALLPGVSRLLDRAAALGIGRVILAQDAHPPDSPEFAAFPPHCLSGTREAETVPEIATRPDFGGMTVFPKGSLNVGLEPSFAAFVQANPLLHTWIVVGDCTDLCVHAAAMHLRMLANTQGGERLVVVPAGLVDTYDLPLEAARRLGAMPHDGDLMHRLFLYHLALNGVRVVEDLV